MLIQMHKTGENELRNKLEGKEKKKKKKKKKKKFIFEKKIKIKFYWFSDLIS